MQGKAKKKTQYSDSGDDSDFETQASATSLTSTQKLRQDDPSAARKPFTAARRLRHANSPDFLTSGACLCSVAEEEEGACQEGRAGGAGPRGAQPQLRARGHRGGGAGAQRRFQQVRIMGLAAHDFLRKHTSMQ